MSNIIDSIQLSGVTYQIQGSGGGGVPESTFTAYTATTDERISQDEEVTAAGLNALNDKITPTVELTQAEYDALVTARTVSADTYYIITDAQAGDLTQYWTSAQTNSAITQAVSGKQDTLVSGTNIKTVNNTSILGSGNISVEGKGVAAGRGITVTTGATADTVSFNLPISGGTGSRSIIEGLATVANGTQSHAEGQATYARGINSHAEGNGTETKNEAEHASGKYNVSSSASTTFGDSGNTLFSVGNGTPSARHNAFEIRQNGNIYINYDSADIILQDKLGEIEQVTAASLNALNDNFGGLKLVKLTQAEYNALATKDQSTLYVIVN